MFIKAISLDGFKSYAQRTEVTGFDPMFNAVTGLNGSGKSNILDGICFVLGITNLSQVRATNLQELVYKNGQAGITKATVSITFDNSNKKQSPMGYEMYDEITVTRQVVVGGRNKYLINGSNATNTRVQDLFRSVQLNVNNPHFLIMQGRITKVLNMKPAEILSMIEEAAGTRLYESKKEAAQKTIEKKDSKLKEIDSILKEEITPTLAKLKDERSSYLEYQKIIRELEHLNKLFIAYRFVCAEEQRKRSSDELSLTQKIIEATKTSLKEMAVKMTELEANVGEIEKRRDKEVGGSVEKLESEVSSKHKIYIKAQSDLRSVLEAKKTDLEELKKLERQYAKDVAGMKEHQKKLDSMLIRLETLKSLSELDAKNFKVAQQHFQEVNAGLIRNEDGAYASLNDQLMAAKKEISQSETQIKQAKMSVANAKQILEEQTDSLKKTETSYKKDEAVCKIIKTSLLQLQADLSALGYEEGKEEKIIADKKQLSNEVQNLQEKLEKLESRFPQLQFDYKDPEKGFDHKSVHGLVVSLITVKEPKTATALEVSAGGKLYNVVVDTEVCGKKLLEKGELKRRVTIIPLNKISATAINCDVIRRAESLAGKENVHTALSLVGYKTELQSAMEFVFGNSFVCTDMDVAKKVTFDEMVNKKSVTLDGDSFDPAGTLTGGARIQTGSVLLGLTDINEASQFLMVAQQKLQQVDHALKTVKVVACKWRELKQQCDLKNQELKLLTNKLKQSSHGQQLEEIDCLQTTIADQDAVLKRAAEMKNKAVARVAEIEDKLKNAGAVREKELKQAEREVDQTKKKYDESIKTMKDIEKDAEQVQLELLDIDKELKSTEDQMSSLKDKISNLVKQLATLNETADSTKAQLIESQEKLNAQKELLKVCTKEISEMQAERSRIVKDCNNSQLQLQELDHKVSKCQKDLKDAARSVDQMLSDHSWILEEKRYFGHSNTAYDFKTNDPKEAGRRIQKLQETKDKLSKSVNMRAMNMLGKAEEQYVDLMKKRTIVLSDKAKIASVIAELDEKKNEALKKAYDQVNKDFGSIFSTLLPGSKAKLIAPEGQGILDGLEFKIAFGDVWKDSLSELSGGQRSLVALSLILSLLLFNPAPLYILDEVDAALDLSHTQNIGQMLKTHFRHSQFVVVSLKDGMFSNANVLFKTKFVDGVSSVTRHVQRQ